MIKQDKSAAEQKVPRKLYTRVRNSPPEPSSSQNGCGAGCQPLKRLYTIDYATRSRIIEKENAELRNKLSELEQCQSITPVAKITAVPSLPVPVPQAPSVVVKVEPTDVKMPKVKAAPVQQTSERPNAGQSADRLAASLDYRVLDGVIYVRMASNKGAFTLLNDHDLMVLLNCKFHEEAVRCGSVKHLRDIKEFLIIDPAHIISAQDAAGMRTRINFADGFYDVLTKNYCPYDGRFFINYLDVRTSDVQNAGVPINFDRLLWMMANGNPDIYAKLWEMISLCISNDFRPKVIWLLQGVGNSCKSTLMAIMRLLYPEDQTADFVFSDFEYQFTETELFGKALNLGDENGKIIPSNAVEALKRWSAGEHSRATVKVKHQGAKRVIPRTHLVFATNNHEFFEDATDAFYGRLQVIPLTSPVDLSVFGVEDPVYDLFRYEIPAIIKKAIGVYHGLKERNFQFSGKFRLNDVVDGGAKGRHADFVLEALEEFVSEKVIPVEGSDLFLEDFGDAYNAWCESVGKKDYVVMQPRRLRDLIVKVRPDVEFGNVYNPRRGGERSALKNYGLRI